MVRFDAEDDVDPPARRTMDVVEEERAPVCTGLLDASGVPIYRFEDRQPIGFYVGDGG